MSEIEITEVDREAAALFAEDKNGGLPAFIAAPIRNGNMDWSVIVQAFARHRHEARVEALADGKNNWDGLARSIMMAFDCDAKTPRAIFKHLSMVGQPVPKWMRDEPEMQNLDHVISKGTRCVLIYRAMAEPALRSGEREGV